LEFFRSPEKFFFLVFQDYVWIYNKGQVNYVWICAKTLKGKPFRLINLPFYLLGRLDDVLGQIVC
jgi:hypothetical protein